MRAGRSRGPDYETGDGEGLAEVGDDGWSEASAR
jgi:hypothetical protein